MSFKFRWSVLSEVWPPNVKSRRLSGLDCPQHHDLRISSGRDLFRIDSMIRKYTTSWLCLLLASFGCEDGEDRGPDNAQILAIGDSILAWNLDASASIPQVVGQGLDRTIRNNAVGGARIVDPFGGAEGADIRQQYQAGDWDWVLLNGGGNDLNDGCGCGECGALLDSLISEDGSAGTIPEFVTSLIQQNKKVMYLGYYDIPQGAEFGFGRCTPLFQTQHQRLQRMADLLTSAWYVSAGDVVSPMDESNYDSDLVHPSVTGGQRVGAHIAQAIRDAEAQ